MPDYQQGKIYCIRSHQTDDIYIGSTSKKYLSQRFAQHKSDYKYYLKTKKHYITSYKILEYEDAYIELIENYPCNSKEELTREEGKYQRDMDCVNKQIAGRTNEEWCKNNKEHLSEQNKQYYNNNKEEIAKKNKVWRENNKEQQKQYRENNKEQKAEYQKQYFLDNKEHLSEQKKQYYNNNKEKLLEKAKEYREENKEHIASQQKKYKEENREKINQTSKIQITCECGGHYSKSNKTKHLKSNKHNNFLKQSV